MDGRTLKTAAKYFAAIAGAIAVVFALMTAVNFITSHASGNTQNSTLSSRADATAAVAVAMAVDTTTTPPAPQPSPSGAKCDNCYGTGKSGDGLAKCKVCKGTGKKLVSAEVGSQPELTRECQCENCRCSDCKCGELSGRFERLESDVAKLVAMSVPSANGSDGAAVVPTGKLQTIYPYKEAVHLSERPGALPLLIYCECNGCPPCATMWSQTMEPMHAAGEFSGVILARINCDDEPASAQGLGVHARPALVGYVQSGGSWRRIVQHGQMSQDSVRQFLKSVQKLASPDAKNVNRASP